MGLSELPAGSEVDVRELKVVDYKSKQGVRRAY